MITDNRVLIIAEAGVNHNGSIERAIDMIQVAKESGADVVKFQTAIPQLVMTKDADKAAYQLHNTEKNETQLEMAKRIHLPLNSYKKLKAKCENLEIEFMSTAFDNVSIKTLKKLDLKRYKIPSGEITNLPYLRQIGQYGKQMILSTGMATLGEIETALDVLEVSGTPREQMTVLHCNTEYPTLMEDVNLRVMLAIREAFGVSVGYSDHTLGIEAPVAAVALGASVIEKHFTLDRTLLGPDHRASLEPDELNAMVRAIRNIEKALGDGIKRPSPSEAKNKPIARKSLVAATTIRAGEPFTDTNLTVKRPGTGISPMRWDEVLGRSAIRDFAEDELIEY